MLTPEDLLGARILIVDDEPDIVEVLRFKLAAEGYRHIRSTSTSSEALGLYRECKIGRAHV